MPDIPLKVYKVPGGLFDIGPAGRGGEIDPKELYEAYRSDPNVKQSVDFEIGRRGKDEPLIAQAYQKIIGGDFANIQTPYATNPATGVLSNKKDLEREATEQADLAAGKLRQVPITGAGGATGTVPVGSPADQALKDPEAVKKPEEAQLQEFANKNPEAADALMDKLGFASSPIAPSLPTPAVSMPTLSVGSSGELVKQIQNQLGIKSDGIFGPKTQAAVKQWQSAHGLTPDGIVGPQTWASFQGATNPNITSNVGAGASSNQKGGGAGGVTTPSGKTFSTGNPTMDALFNLFQNQSAQTSFTQVYKEIYKELGLENMKADYEKQVKAFADLQNEKNEKISEINNNPWFSESKRVSELRSLDAKYENKELILTNKMKLLETTMTNARSDAQFVAGKMMEQLNQTSKLNENIIMKAIDLAEKQAEAERKAAEVESEVVTVNGRKVLINKDTGAVIKDLGRSSEGDGDGPSTKPAGYTVKSGDTFFNLATSRGLTVDALRRANPNVDENNMRLGQRINIPSSSSGAPKGSGSSDTATEKNIEYKAEIWLRNQKGFTESDINKFKADANFKAWVINKAGLSK